MKESSKDITSEKSEPLSLRFSSMIAVALPLSIGAFVQFLVLFTDNFFLAKVSDEAISGAGIAAMIYITASMFISGMASGTQIFVARKQGENQSHEVGKYFANGLLLCVVLSLLLGGLIQLTSNYLLPSWTKGKEVLLVAQEFLNIRLLGMIFYAILMALVAFYVGIARTGILIFSTVITAGLNIVLDYALITGNWSFPAFGHEGAAWATVASEFIGFIFLLSYTLFFGDGKKLQLKGAIRTIGIQPAKEMLILSFPLMLQQVIALATWTLFFFLVEKVGVLELKVSNLVRTLYMLAFVILMGVGQTTRTYISTLIASGRQSELPQAIKKLISMNIIGVVILCHGFVLYPEYISTYFFQPSETIGIEAFVKSTRVVFFSIILFSFSGVFINVIEGSGRTWVGFGVELSSIFIYLFVVYFITIVYPQEIHIIWMSDYVYFGMMGLMSGLFLLFGNWKNHQL